MFKTLILQQWYGLSDLEVEKHMANRISFTAFPGFPDTFPDSRTIWLFKERMGKIEKDKVVWEELQRQLNAMGLRVKHGGSRMLHSLKQIQDRPPNRKVVMLRLGAVEMEPRLRRR